MKSASSPLIALLATRQFNYASLFEFDLIGGGKLYYTNCDTPIVSGGNTYITPKQSGVIIDRKGARAKVKWRVGVEVDTLTFDVLPNSGTVNGQDFLAAVGQGVFDGANCIFSHAYWPIQAWASSITPTGVVVMFAGSVGSIQSGRSIASFTINSYLNLLNINLPRNIYQGGCVNTLYDTACTLNPESFKEVGAVSASSTTSIINATLTGATGLYDLGKVLFTSGVNSGISRSVKSYVKGSPGTIALMSPFPNTPATSDAFKIYEGCNKLQTTCVNKFNNLANFRGTPYIPENSTGV